MADILPHDKERVEQFVVEGLIKGYPNSELLVLMKREFKEVDDEHLEKALKTGYNAIRDTTLTDIDKIIPTHIEIYEKIYNEFEELYYVPGKLKAMRGKEKLLGLHKETNTIEIHNELNVEIETESEYDFNKLSGQEQDRLQDYMKRVADK